MACGVGIGFVGKFAVGSTAHCGIAVHRMRLVQTSSALIMNSDKAFFGTILAMMALLFGYPVAAFFIFLIAVMA